MSYLRLVKRASKLHFEQGASVEEASRAIHLGEYAGWAEPERVMHNVQRLYQELPGRVAKAPGDEFQIAG